MTRRVGWMGAAGVGVAGVVWLAAAAPGGRDAVRGPGGDGARAEAGAAEPGVSAAVRPVSAEVARARERAAVDAGPRRWRFGDAADFNAYAVVADVSGDGALGAEDLHVFTGWWVGTDARADFDRDGSVGNSDILAFVDAYLRGERRALEGC